MSDLVVTVAQTFWPEWIAEGDAAGEPASGEEWGFYLGVGGPRPDIRAGERLYIVSCGLLRGYAPVTRLARTETHWVICREGGGVAVTLLDKDHAHRPLCIPGFRGWRRRWWDTAYEVPFPAWKTAGVRGAPVSLDGTVPPNVEWVVERHNGRKSGPDDAKGWVPKFQGNEDEARDFFRDLWLEMRQGGVRLVRPGGVVDKELHAPRLRSRW